MVNAKALWYIEPLDTMLLSSTRPVIPDRSTYVKEGSGQDYMEDRKVLWVP